MDGSDFIIPSPKRQRTESPGVSKIRDGLPPATGQTEEVLDDKHPPTTIDVNLEAEKENNSMLDTLMQHVESESLPLTSSAAASAPAVTDSVTTNNNQVIPTNDSLNGTDDQKTDSTQAKILSTTNSTDDVTRGDSELPTAEQDRLQSHEVEVDEHMTGDDAERTQIQEPVQPTLPGLSVDTGNGSVITPQPTQQQEDAGAALSQAQATVDGIPPTVDTALSADGGEGVEWEVDSSPYESSSSDTSDSSSDEDSDDDDADGDYAMLDPEEQARILMQGDGGSDDEGDKSKSKSEGAGLRTANEQNEDVPAIPDVTITEDMDIVELGAVEYVVEKTVLIRAKISGEYQVLQPGSLLCHKDRKVAGVVADLFGRVEEPLYTVQFQSVQDIENRGLSATGTSVFYVPSHSTFVFTQPLKAIKGSDASNFHDEEVGDEEMEFSDDEAEAEHKRNLKLKRQGKLGDFARGRGTGRGGRGGQRGQRSGSVSSYVDVNNSSYGNGSIEMNYDDVDDGEEGYTPLSRPTNLHQPVDQMTAASIPSMLPPMVSNNQFDRGRGRGRGGRDRGRGNRGGRPNGRGGPYQQNRQGSDRPPFNNQVPQSNGQQQSPFPQMSLPMPPPPPILAPQGSTFSHSLATSPMSPLPRQQFNFPSAFQPQGPQGYNPQQYQQQSYGQQQQAPYYQPPAMQQYMHQQFQQQQQQHQQHHYQQQQQHQPQQQQQNGGYANSWQTNQAAVAEVQKQLEQMRRGYNGQQQ